MSENTVQTIDVAAPLSLEQIKSFFENKNIFFNIDYHKSALKDEMLLTYVSNLDLPCDLDLKKSDIPNLNPLIKSFMTTKSLFDSKILKNLTAYILLHKKGIAGEFLKTQELMTLEFAEQFISENQDLVDRWIHFVDSTFLYLVSSVEAVNEVYKFDSLFPSVNDPNYVGHNIVTLFSIPGFLETYFSKNFPTRISYFKVQFEEYIYKGKNFFYYFSHENNLLALVFDELMAGKISMENLGNFGSNSNAYFDSVQK